MRHSFVNTVAGEDVFSKSSHLRPDATATLKDHANSLAADLLLEPETISPADYREWGWDFSSLRSRIQVEIAPYPRFDV